MDGPLQVKAERIDSVPGETSPKRLDFSDPLRLLPRILCKLYTMWVTSLHPFHSIGKGASFHYTTNLHNAALMQIGDYLTVHKDVWLHGKEPDAGHEGPTLIIGDRCFIARRCHISAKNRVCIEDNVLFAASVLVQDHGHEFSDVTRPITEQGPAKGGTIRIGQGSWIGQGAVIVCDSGELSLGRNCVVAANAVVTKSAPDYSVIAGNPARIVKQFDPTKGTWVLGSVRRMEPEASEPRSAQLVGV